MRLEGKNHKNRGRKRDPPRMERDEKRGSNIRENHRRNRAAVYGRKIKNLPSRGNSNARGRGK